jgi:hypothetical protein
VKTLKENAMTKEEFLKEAELMKKIRHAKV